MARPTKYDEEKMLAVLNGMGRDGEGMAEAIVACEIARETFYRWIDEHPAFSNAVNEMRARSQAWWEKHGRLRTFDSKDFNATAFIFNMKNRFKDDWNDMQTVQHTGKVDGVILAPLQPADDAPDN